LYGKKFGIKNVSIRNTYKMRHGTLKSIYRVGHLAFGISTTGYFEFERRNNIYDISEI